MSDLPYINTIANKVARLSGVFVAAILLCVFGTFWSLPLSADSMRWRWSNPSPHGGNVYDMAYGLGLTVQVAERGQIYTSEDLVSWQLQDSGVTNSLRGVTFFKESIVVVGENGIIVYASSLSDFRSVDLATTNWLVGVAATSSEVVAVGDNGSIYVSSDLTNWTKQTLPAGADSQRWLTGVAAGNNSYVVVGEGGYIASSSNGGANWMKRSSGTSRNLTRVQYSGGKFWVTAENGTVLSSTSGASWTAASPTPATTNTLYGAVNGTSDLNVVGHGEVLLKNNSGTWTNQLLISSSYRPPNWTYYNTLWEDSFYFISGRSGTMVEGLPTNSTEYAWVNRFDSIRNWLWDVSSTSNVMVTVGDRATILSSVDGVSWELELVPDSLTNAVFLGAGSNGRGMVVVGNRGAMGFSSNRTVNVILTNSIGVILTNPTSALGIEWTAISPRPTTNDLQGVAANEAGYVVVGGNGTILTSPDGYTWTKQTSPTSRFLTGVATYAGGYVATGDRGTLLTSANGVSWTSRASGTTNWLYRVRQLNGKLVAVGENGTVLTSTDGISWALSSSGTSAWLNDATFSEGIYYAVGNQGTVLRSLDAITWSPIGTITQKSLYGAGAFGSRLIAVGVEGVILRGQVAGDTTPVKLLGYSLVEGQGACLVAGKTDQSFTIQRSTNLVNWEDGVTFEIGEKNGTVLILEAPDTNSPPQGFIRARMVP